MTPEQALLALQQAARQAPLNYQSHMAIDEAVKTLAECCQLTEQPEAEEDGEEESQIS